MARVVEWSEWKVRRRATLGIVVAMRSAHGRTQRTRPRSDEKRAVLQHMARVAIREQASRLERIGPREYILHPRAGRTTLGR